MTKAIRAMVADDCDEVSLTAHTLQVNYMYQQLNYTHFVLGCIGNGNHESRCAQTLREAGIRARQTLVSVLLERRRRAATQTLAAIDRCLRRHSQRNAHAHTLLSDDLQLAMHLNRFSSLVKNTQLSSPPC